MGGRTGIRVQASGSRHIQTATQKQNTAETAAIHQRSGNWYSIRQHEKAIMLNAKYLARRGTARRSSQSLTIGPKKRCWCSQRWKRGEARAQQAAARITNGVVGKMGRKMPRMPSSSAIAPKSQNRGRNPLVLKILLAPSHRSIALKLDSNYLANIKYKGHYSDLIWIVR